MTTTNTTQEELLPCPEWRVALVLSSSSPKHPIPWLCGDKADQARVERHGSFIRWLSDSTPPAEQPAEGMTDADFLREVINLCVYRGPTPEAIEEFDSEDKWIADIWREADRRKSHLASKREQPPDHIEDKLDMVADHMADNLNMVPATAQELLELPQIVQEFVDCRYMGAVVVESNQYAAVCDYIAAAVQATAALRDEVQRLKDAGLFFELKFHEAGIEIAQLREQAERDAKENIENLQFISSSIHDCKMISDEASCYLGGMVDRAIDASVAKQKEQS